MADTETTTATTRATRAAAGATRATAGAATTATTTEATRAATIPQHGDRAAPGHPPGGGPGTALESLVTVLAIALVGVVSAAVHASAV